jgi:FKBP-type peptidyl-prolyl cis-trans isomerase 2
MAGAKTADTVKVHYTGKLTDGTIFDDSLNREPLEFTIGNNNLIAGFENAVIGMNVGDWKTVNIPSEQAYGPHMKEMVVEVDRKQLPPDLKPVIGAQLQVTQDEGQEIVVSITQITETHVTLDANHPLAGKDLVFEIKLVEILPPCSCCH